MSILSIFLDAFATGVVLCVGFVLLLFRKSSDFMWEHAGHPRSGVDPVRVAIWVVAALVLWSIWS